MTRICKNCQELVFGPLCPFCERQASKLSDDDYSLDSEIEVDDGTSSWGGETGMSVLSYDDVFGDDSDD